MKNFTTSHKLNDIQKDLSEKYIKQVNRLISPNCNTIVEYRHNGVVTNNKENEYIFHALADMDLKNWRITFTSDVTHQFKEV